MQRTDLPDLADPEFTPIRAALARAYLLHRADLGVAYRNDADIVDKSTRSHGFC